MDDESYNDFLWETGRATREEKITILVRNIKLYESPCKEDLNKVTPFIMGSKLLPLMTEKTILTIQLIVEFSKNIPGFSTLCKEDQTILLKANRSEVIILRTARKYDRKKKSIFFADNGPFTKQNFCNAYMGLFGDAIFDFCELLAGMQVDDAEYALLTAIVIFSDVPTLQSKVYEMENYYKNLLRDYTEVNRPGKDRFSKLLSMLPQLTSAGKLFSDLCSILKVDFKKLPSLLRETLMRYSAVARTAQAID